MMKSWLVLGSLLIAGCNLYFGGDDQPPMCTEPYPGAPLDVRNPQTGECEAGWGGGGGGCGIGNDVGAGALPNWATCGGPCDALGESACLATTGCHAEYTVAAYDSPPPGGFNLFWTCAATAPYGDPSAVCDSLNAQDCAERDDCASTYNFTYDGSSATHAFGQCFPEPGHTSACAAIFCGPDSHCEEQCTCDPKQPNDICVLLCTATCVPNADCAAVQCETGSHCEESCVTPVCDPGPNAGVCAPLTCVAECVPNALDPGDCYGAVACDAAPPACPAGTTPGVANGCWTGYCIPTSQCSHDPGTCSNGGGVMCALAPPACPSGTQPGIKDGCWSGYCIPNSACGPIACEAIVDEGTCLARGDCSAVYAGTDCTCDPSGACTCKDTKFARCATGGKL
jgi:hypothetical protein